MATETIDTSAAQYVQLYNGTATLRTVMTPRLVLFKKLPIAKKRQWLERDPLLRRTLKLGLDLRDYIENIEEELEVEF